MSCRAMGSPIAWPMGARIAGGVGCCAASVRVPSTSAARSGLGFIGGFAPFPNTSARDCAARLALQVSGPGMFSLMPGLIRRVLALAALGTLGLARPAPASGQTGVDAWGPQTVPLFGASYSADIGLLVGLGITHTRYGFHALPPSTRLLAEAAYATSANPYREKVPGALRRPLLPTILY